MEVSPSGQDSSPMTQGMTDPVALLHLLVNLQSQSVELQRQTLEHQHQQLELARESAQFIRDQRTRQAAELERWQVCHQDVVDSGREALTQLEQVHASLMADLAVHVAENHENLVDGDFALSDFVDRFGPRLAHLNTMLAILRPLAAASKKAEG